MRINFFRNIKLRKLITSDLLFKFFTAVVASSVLIILALMSFKLVQESLLSIKKYGLNFLLQTTWDPVFEVFGALPFIYGTVITSTIALLIGVPISVGVALVLSDFAPIRIRSPLSFLVELLAAVPSVIYGLWGIFVLAPFFRDYIYPFLQSILGFLPFFQGPIFGLGMLTGGIILAIMIIPIVSAVSREAFVAVPSIQKEAAIALGATKWEAARMMMSYASPAIIGAIMLGLARAIGETMAVTMVIGNRPEISISLFAPSYTMAAVIANEFTEATYDLYLSALIEVGLILFIIAMIVNVFARLVVWRSMRIFREAKL